MRDYASIAWIGYGRAISACLYTHHNSQYALRQAVTLAVVLGDIHPLAAVADDRAVLRRTAHIPGHRGSCCIVEDYMYCICIMAR